MEHDVTTLLDSGALGLVFGCLDKQGGVDTASATRLITAARARLASVRSRTLTSTHQESPSPAVHNTCFRAPDSPQIQSDFDVTE